MKKVEGQDYAVRLVDFGTSDVDGVIVSSDGDFANIYINSRVCEKRRLSAYRHELTHLERDDLYSSVPVSILETTI